MYIVVSRWEVHPGKEAEFEEMGAVVRGKLRSMPEIEILHGFKNKQGQVVVTVCYTDEPAYHRLIHADDGPFQKLMAEHRLEDVSNCVSSERGEEIG